MTAIDISTLNVLVVGIVRDVASTIEIDISRFKKAFAGFRTTKFFLVESDSVDQSVQVLATLKSNEKYLSFVSLGSLKDKFPTRAERLAYARNVYLNALENNREYKDCSILVVADFNDLNKLLTRHAVESVFLDSYWSVRTANQTGPYYDIWALRHPIWSPNDCWESHQFLRRYRKFPELALYAAVNSRMIKIPKFSEPIAVESAFGGLGIYKRDAIIGKRYAGIDQDTGREVCEHVPLNQSIARENLIIEVYPKLINMKKTDHTDRFGLIKSIIRIMRYLPTYILKKFQQ